jgi:hypothetical protein
VTEESGPEVADWGWWGQQELWVKRLEREFPATIPRWHWVCPTFSWHILRPPKELSGVDVACREFYVWG